MNILSSVAGKIAEYTIAPIGQQVGYFLFYNNNLKELTYQAEELENARDRIIHLVETERRNGKEIEADVQTWLHRVDESLGEAKQICEDPSHAKLVGCSTWGLLNLRLRHQLSRKAKKKAIDIADVQGKGKFDTVGYLPPLDGIGSTFAERGKSEKLGSRNTMKLEILEALKDPKLSKIGVYGLGGVGKTTLVKQVAQEAEEDNLFDWVVLSHVSQTPDLERIQGEVADLLGLHFDEMTIAGRARRLRERIKKEKTILIILDDIWARLDLEKVGIPFGDGFKGCKVLLTSRTQDVLQEMETQKDFRLEALDEHETWSLFRDMTGEVDKDHVLRDIAIEVAKRCAGLPVLIVTVARALKNKGIHDWKDALRQLARIDNKEMHEITYSALELSFNRLENNEVKALFLLCGVGFDSVQDLLKYVLGLHIFKHIDTVEDARNRLYKIISSLKASCLFLEDKTNVMRVKMHDIVREVAISIASRDYYVFTKTRCFKLEEWPTRDFLKRCSQIILIDICIQKLPERLDCPQVKFFHLNSSKNHYLEVPDSFFEGMGKLQVLDLTCLNMSSLPTSLCSLAELKTLCLDHCALENMSGIGALINLEILSLIHSSIQKLPSEIGQLTHLIMLDLTKCGIEFIPPNILSRLTKLEELCMGNIPIMWQIENVAKQNESASLAELMHLPNLTALEIQILEAWVLPRDLMFEKLERYNIVIGDVWEWSNQDESLKTLKLKLGSSIHLEHGIKTLIKRVENLYLDEIGGISNVLFQLNGEGFPLLKHLQVQNNADIQHIINSMEWMNQAHNAFPVLETLVLHSLSNLQKICHGPLVNPFNKLGLIKVECCDQLKYLLSCSMVKRLPQLTNIEVSKCNSLESIVFGDNDVGDGRDMAVDQIEFTQLRSLTLQQLSNLDDFYCIQSTSFMTNAPKVELPKLETLKLSALKLNKIWHNDLLSTATYMQNLTKLTVEDCVDIKYLFPSSVARNLKNLRQLQISNCSMMEEIIALEEGRDNDVAVPEVRCPKLEILIINDMENLKKIWHCEFDGLKMLRVKNCNKVTTLFPSYVKGRFDNLEILMVDSCCSIEMIFELNANETHVEESITQLRILTLNGLPMLKQIWNEDPQGISDFHKLQTVKVDNCANLEYVFPLSIAKGLMNLEYLYIWYCPILVEIVAKGEEKLEEPTAFVLNRLTTLDLRNLSKLMGYYSGNYTLACPTLEWLHVFQCNRLELFKTHSMSSQEWLHHGGKLRISIAQPLFTIEEVIPNLELLTVNSKNARAILQHQFSRDLFRKLKCLWVTEVGDESDFPVYFLQDIPSLEELAVQWSSFKEVFQHKRLLGEEGQNKVGTQLKKLRLLALPELQHICKEGSQIDPVLEVLEFLSVDRCSNLMNLVPSSVSFSRLTCLKVKNCNGLKHLIASSTARSLSKLETMKIEACNSLVEIVTGNEDETKDVISFNGLAVLELTCLPRLCRFSSCTCYMKFPILKEVIVKQCSRMKMFSKENTSTPNLRKVQTEENVKYQCWEGSLNGTIKKMFTDMVAFNSFKHLKLSEYPELKYMWYGQFEHKIFSNLKSVVVQKCDFVSNVLLSSNLMQALQNLEELEVSECDILEVVFDVKGFNDKEIGTTQLKKLTLSSLPNLKHVWNKDPQEILSFEHLEELDIESCGAQEIVAMEEGSKEFVRFNFPKLTKLRLVSMSTLKSFYPSMHALECPSLKILNVYDCDEGLRIFDFDYLDLEQSHEVDEANIPISHAPFVEKICPNLKELALNGKDAMIIQKVHSQEDLFENVEFLRLQCFHETPALFPYDFLQRFPNLVKLNVRSSSFDTLVPVKAIAPHYTGPLTQINFLWLHKLDGLKYIWNEDRQSDPHGDIFETSEIDKAPYSMPFKNLTILKVTDCKGVTYLTKSLTVKFLVQLRGLAIQNCEMIEDVVQIDEQEEGEEITFENLEYLKFISLPSFRSFCCGKQTLIFPSLEDFVVKECPQMKTFSSGVILTPFLTTVEVENNKKCWKGDLNTTVKQLFLERNQASSSKS